MPDPLTGDYVTRSAEKPAPSRLAQWACTALAIAIAAVAAAPGAAAAGRGIVLDVDGAIGLAIAEYVTRELREANASGARVVILRMNTPGGLDTSMREIVSAILASPV